MTLRFIRRKVARPFFMIPMCALILYFTVDVKAHAANTLGNYSDAALFRGIFFAEGEVAAAIPELKGLNVRDYISDAGKLQSVLDRQNAIFNAMSTTGYFKTLQDAVNSHNRLEIQRVLAVGSSLFKDKVAELGFGLSPEQEQEILKNIKQEDYSRASVAEVKAAAKSHAEAIAQDHQPGLRSSIVLPVVFVVTILLVQIIFLSLVESGDSSLYQESLVNSIARL